MFLIKNKDELERFTLLMEELTQRKDKNFARMFVNGVTYSVKKVGSEFTFIKEMETTKLSFSNEHIKTVDCLKEYFYSMLLHHYLYD